MAGFQQAANALTGAVGTVANRVGLYSELVGKNREYRAQLEKQNADLEKAKEEQAVLAEKNKKQAESLQNLIDEKKAQKNLYNKNYRARQKAKKAAENERAKSEVGRLDRALSNNQAYMSKELALSLLYGDFASGSGGI